MHLEIQGNWNSDVIEAARNYSMTDVADLLERFKENPVKIRHATKLELGFLDELAAEMFAMVVFVSDGLLQTKETTTPSPAAGFFSIVKRLPLELQMLICYKGVESNKEIIPSIVSEIAFRELAKRM